MIITNLPDLHKFLKGINKKGDDRLTIDLVHQSFTKKSLQTFTERISQIKDDVKHLSLIMRDNEYEEEFEPSRKDFQKLGNINEKFESVRLNFKNLLYPSTQTLKLMVKLGQVIVRKSGRNENNEQLLNCLELQYSSFFTFILDQFQFKLHLTKSIKDEKILKIFGKIKDILLVWPLLFQHIDININLSEVNCQGSTHIIDLLSSLDTYKKAQVIKINLQMKNLSQNSINLKNQFFNFNREHIKVFEYNITGENPFTLFGQTKNLNSNLTYANFNFSISADHFKICLKKKCLNIRANIRSDKFLNQETQFKQIIQTWNMERVENLELFDYNGKFIDAILQDTKMKKLKELKIQLVGQDSYNHTYSGVNLIKISESMNSLKQIQTFCITIGQLSIQQNELKQLCQFLTSLSNLKYLSIDLRNSSFVTHSQVSQILSDGLVTLSQTMEVLNIIFPEYRSYFVYNEINYEIHHLTKIFSSLSNLQQFSILGGKQNIEFSNEQLNLVLKVQQTNDLVGSLSQFSSTNLKTQNLKSIKADLSITQEIKGGDNIMKALLRDIKPTIKKIIINLKSQQTQGSYFNFDIPFSEYEGELQITQDNSIKVVVNDSNIELNMFSEDLNCFQRDKQQTSIQDIVDFLQNPDENQIIEFQEPRVGERNNNNIVLINQNNNQYKNFYGIFQNLRHINKQITLGFNLYDYQLFKELIENFPKNEKIKLNLQNSRISDREMINLKDIFQNTSKSIKQFSLDISKNRIHNQGSITLFLKLQQLQKGLQKFGLNMSETFIRTKGLISLFNKLIKFKNLQHLEIDFSNPSTIYSLKEDVIASLFKAVQKTSKPYLETLIIIAESSHIDLNKQFFDSLISTFSKFALSLKKIHLNFQNNYLFSDINKFPSCLKNLPPNLEYFYLNLRNTQHVTEEFLISFMKQANSFIKQRTLKHFEMILFDRIVNNNYSEKYFAYSIQLILSLLNSESVIKSFSSMNATIKMDQKVVNEFNCIELVNNIQGITLEKKQQLSLYYYEQMIHKSPINVKLTQNQIQLN